MSAACEAIYGIPARAVRMCRSRRFPPPAAPRRWAVDLFALPLRVPRRRSGALPLTAQLAESSRKLARRANNEPARRVFFARKPGRIG